MVQVLLGGAKKEDLAEGLCKAIKMCEEILKPHFPIQPDDVNELSNQLVIKD